MEYCHVQLGQRFPCLAREEIAALAEIGRCETVETKGDTVVFACKSCEIFKRAALAKSVNGIRIKKDKPSIARSTKTLDHITARLLVNLARVTPGDRVWEPFVGTGAVAHEVERVGGYVVGGDLDLKALLLAKRNVSSDLVLSNAMRPPLRGYFDAAVGDPPYGRLAKSDMEIRALLNSFIETAYLHVKKGGYIVFASPIYVDIASLKSCMMYLHGGLYRVVYIVKVD
ncbi:MULTISPECIES: TRM11 family methyltransferase [Pyrobaculum]|uniref:RNA methyltransferase n=2 Tax=Pyrobaculum arsenaticum TaxID=121277 RepID=A0A7L4PFU9_9CREN|nr:RNA methyltransferase [Pyrobaculum arsenaticum]ABP51531.1 putative RNA methylase [Pyrobaculum arsenaticum DSM 13514]MCY0891009.1 RNA methyltransferase [Pyrobaculum arsenaticum]NYR16500.1 RNA methyltransferase [Pyrobaculum arsenaticum]